MKRVIPGLIALSLSFPSIASSNIVNEMSHIGFGYKHSTLKAEAMEPYFDSKYVNSEEKSMGGLYLDMGLGVTDTLFIEGNADFITRVSSEIDSWSLGGGVNAPINQSFSIPVSCGVINYYANRKDSISYSDQAAYCKAGARVQAAKHWFMDLSYQHDFFDISKDTVKLTNVFQFGRVFGLVAGFEASKRNQSERSFNLGVQFTM